MNHGELKTAIADYLHRSDLTTDIPGFITRAEQMIGRDVRIVENNVQDTVTPSSGVAALPTRFAEMRRISTGSGSTLRILRPVSAHAANMYGTSGEAVAYYLSDQIYVLPSSDTDLNIDYYEYPEPLAGDADSATRPILSRYEQLYLTGALAEACLFTQDYEAAQLWGARFDNEVDAANRSAAQAYNPQAISTYNFTGGQPRGI